MSIGLGIGVQRPKQLRSIYSVDGKVPGFTADFINNRYPGYTSLSSAITHARSGNATMTDGYGPELVVNGSYSDGTTGWTANEGFAVNNGVATVTTTSGSAAAYIQQSFSTVNGKTYILTYNLISREPAFKVSIDDDSFSNSGDVISANYNDLGQGSIVFTATSSTAYLRFIANTTTAGKSVSFDSVSVREMPVIKWAPHNLFDYSEDLTNASWTKTATTITANAATAPDGTNNAFEIAHTASSASYANGASLTSGAAHTIRIFAKYVDNQWLRIYNGFSNGNAWYDLQNGVVGSKNSAVTSHSITDVGDGWYLLEHVSDAASASTTIQFLLPTANNGFTEATGTSAYIWAPHIYRSDLGGMVDNPDQPLSRASYVPTTTSAVYLPRIGHHVYNGSAWANEGLLAESEARTNLETYSDVLDAQWTKENSTITEDSAISPAGLEDASLIVETTSNTMHRVKGNFTPTTSTTYTASIYAKKKERTILSIGGAGLYAANEYPEFDLDTGIAYNGGTGNATVNMQDVGNGWFRCSVTFTATGTSQFTFQLADSLVNGAPPSASGKVYTGDGTSGLYLWGAQVEATSSPPSSLIPTSGSSVTRAAESFTIPSANLPWPDPNYIGSERLTGSWAVLSGYDNTVSGTGTSVVVTGGTTTSRCYLEIDGVDTGEVYEATITVNSTSVGNVALYLKDSSNGTGTTLLTETGISTGTTFTGHVAAASGAMSVLLIGSTGADFNVTISVREIDPLSVSIAMDGRVTYADGGATQDALLHRWLADTNNRIYSAISGSGSFVGRMVATQIESGTIIFSSGFANAVSEDVLQSFSYASRHGSTFINDALNGVTNTEDTSPTALPDLSSIDLELAPTYMGTIGTFRVWDKDITDDGLVEATNPSLEPSLSLTFEGTGTNSFVIQDWSE